MPLPAPRLHSTEAPHPAAAAASPHSLLAAQGVGVRAKAGQRGTCSCLLFPWEGHPLQALESVLGKALPLQHSRKKG